MQYRQSCFRPAALNTIHVRRPYAHAGTSAPCSTRRGEQGESVRWLREVEPDIFLIWQVHCAAATAAGTPGLGVASATSAPGASAAATASGTPGLGADAAAASGQVFMAALQTSSQLQRIQEFGDKRPLMLDTTFTTNALKVSCRYPWQLMTWCTARSALPLCYPRSTL